MIQALAEMEDGRKLILLGLSQGNIDRLRQGDPIHVDPAVLLALKPEDTLGGIVIMYGQTEAAIAEMLQAESLIGPDTIVHAVPRGSTKPS